MLDISERKLQEFSNRFIGTQRLVLLEHPRRGKPMSGFTDNYLKVEVNPNPELSNKVVPVALKSLIGMGEEIKGEVLQ